MTTKLLEARKFTVGYEGKVIGRDLDFTINAGEITSLIGPNGSGKTTILRTVAGFLERISGDLILMDREYDQISQAKRSKIMSVMMTERMATDQMTVRDLVAIGRFPYTDMLGRLSSADKEVVDKALNRVALMDISEKTYNDLSDGQKQRALLARAIAQEPRLMLLDEPTSYLDIYHKLKFIDILKELSKENNIGILMSVHELEIAFEISDKIICLGADGLIKAAGTPKEAFSSGVINKLYGLEEERLTSMYGGFLSAIKEVPHG